VAIDGDAGNAIDTQRSRWERCDGDGGGHQRIDRLK
jgi:hypothetical protein